MRQAKVICHDVMAWKGMWEWILRPACLSIGYNIVIKMILASLYLYSYSYSYHLPSYLHTYTCIPHTELENERNKRLIKTSKEKKSNITSRYDMMDR